MKVDRFLASVFLDALSIAPDFKTMSGLYEAVGDEKFSPTLIKETFGENSLDRICLRSANGKSNLVIGSRRFDFIYQPDTPEDDDSIDFETFCHEASEKLSKSLTFFTRSSSRLALVREISIRNLPLSELNEARDKLMSFPAPFQDSKPFEWDWRAASKLDKSFNEKKESINFIATITRRLAVDINIGLYVSNENAYQANAEPLGKPFEQISFSFDINTAGNELTPRFDSNDVNAFLGESFTWHQELMESVFSFLNLGV